MDRAVRGTAAESRSGSVRRRCWTRSQKLPARDMARASAASGAHGHSRRRVDGGAGARRARRNERPERMRIGGRPCNRSRIDRRRRFRDHRDHRLVGDRRSSAQNRITSRTPERRGHDLVRNLAHHAETKTLAPERDRHVDSAMPSPASPHTSAATWYSASRSASITPRPPTRASRKNSRA